MPFCWGRGLYLLIPWLRGCKAIDPPCQLTACSAILPSLTPLTWACSWHFNKTQLGSVS